MKFYFVEFTHNNKAFHKFGITSSKDVLNRFSTRYDSRWEEFNIRVLFSYYNKDDELIKNMEKLMLTRYPKNFILENYLGKPFGYYNGLGGITETVVLTTIQVNEILQSLYKFKGC